MQRYKLNGFNSTRVEFNYINGIHDTIVKGGIFIIASMKREITISRNRICDYQISVVIIQTDSSVIVII